MELVVKRRWWFKAVFWILAWLVVLGLADPVRVGSWLGRNGTKIVARWPADPA